MFRKTLAIILPLSLLWVSTAGVTVAQKSTKSEQTKSARSSKTTKSSKSTKAKTTKSRSSKSKTAKAKSKGRLPRFYGKLELDEKQREKVYDIQADYDQRIEKLQMEIASLKKDRTKKLEGVLKTAQKRQLRQLEKDSSVAAKPSKSKKK